VVQQKSAEWPAQGLYIFFLAPYYSEMNPYSEMNLIEQEWKHIKRNELAGQMFEHEAELAYNVLIGLEASGEKNGHLTRYVHRKAV